MQGFLRIVINHRNHGQATVEYNFSLGKSFVIENISEASIINEELFKHCVKYRSFT